MAKFNNNRLKRAVTANTTFVIPANTAIAAICVENTTANAVTGGIKIGTTNGGTEVLSATTIGANFTDVIETTLSKRFYSSSEDTTIYLQAVTSWNSASLSITICLLNLS